MRPPDSSSHKLIHDIGRRMGDPPQMLSRNKELSAQARQDEARLLGSNVRECSGPVRANGNPTTLSSLTAISQGEEFQPSNRPSKRPRHEDRNVFDLTGDSNAGPTSPPSRHLLASQISTFQKTNGPISRHGEYREVEENMKISRNPRAQRGRLCDPSDEEKFTTYAVQQRRSSYSPKTSSPNAHSIITIDSIGTPKVRSTSSGERPVILEKTKQSGPSVFDANDSFDELQGETTTRPVPKFLDGKKTPVGKLLSPSQKRPQSDIERTVFESSRNVPKKVKRNLNATQSRSDHVKFEICSIRYGLIKKDNGSAGSVKIAVDHEKIVLGEDIVGPFHESVDISIRSVLKFFEGEDPSHKARLALANTNDSPNNPVDIEFLTRDDMLAFGRSLAGFNIKFITKEVDAIDKTFQYHERQMVQQIARARNNHRSEGIPVKKYRTVETPERQTRSSAQHAPDTQKEQISSDGPKSPEDKFRKRWKKPMVYPRIGKNRFEVSVEDRDRLREGEFLNDNLIGFYLRFLQDHLERNNKEAAKRVYFFNSYFFDTLTKVTEGEQGINYSGVEKWTRNVDLFSYDYILVPINQSAHWYIAIICNLPILSSLAKDGNKEQVSVAPETDELSSQPKIEVELVPETPEPQLAPSSLEVPESPVPKDQEQPVNASQVDVPSSSSTKTEAPETEVSATELHPKVHNALEESSASLTRSSRKRKQKVLKVNPTIITFDSLDTNRTVTINRLRAYICREAASKRAVLIEPNQMKGMRARQIPLQPNFSDCGLYLMAYVEKFVQDPDVFITKTLQRKMDVQVDWPKLRSGILRNRLRQFLDDMYEEQGKGKREPTEMKVTMVDRQPVSFLLGSPTPVQEDAEPPKVEPRDSPVESVVYAGEGSVLA
ncbi:hypothetical protein N7495_001231 [Penicillium taxi]|uniref:uncharacterized protein n=1 Tax=Penicillium taxi TaxID=168475 RepID=UPI002544F7E1|nr:uncharacterized protein N7495_001231 [Penicillium taxi]KAJ5908549.1 hypothetical protein N7495_001231 [Penicillium taxi]